MVRSMTAYARKEINAVWGTGAFEICSVNHRYLEISTRLPDLFRCLETILRDKFKHALVRGKIECHLRIELNQPENEMLSLNKKLIQQLGSALDFLKKNYQMEKVNPFDLLRWPGVVTAKEQDVNQISADLMPIFDSCLAQLIQSREREGRALGLMIEQRLDHIRDEIDKISQQMPAVLTAQKEKLTAKLTEVAIDIDADNHRFEQELILIIQRIDITEELDRLIAHIDEVRRILQKEETMGRRLDFMMQELNREANTIASKSINTTVTNSAIELKVLVEQMREQIQNIE